MSHPPASSVGEIALAAFTVAVIVIAPFPSVAAEGADCGGALGEGLRARWLAAGGASGSLGCPLDPLPSSVTARSGAKAREARFAAAGLLQHASGPWSGRTFLVVGCAWRLYFQYGGAAGWLGLPKNEAINTPDGKRQSFEGGAIRTDRNGACEAEASAPAAPVSTPTSPIDLFHAANGDDAVAGDLATAARLTAQGYQRVETLGYGLANAAPGATPLRQFADGRGEAHLPAATAETEAAARAKAFQFEGVEGYVLTDPGPGRLALKLYWNAATGRGLLATSSADEADARARGYAFVRIEGYVLAGPRS